MAKERSAYRSAALMALIGGAVASAAWANPPDNPAEGSEPAERALPQSGVLSSIGQSWKGADSDIVIGYFELGTAPKLRRFYCLANARTGKREPNGAIGSTFVKKDGTTGINLTSVSLYLCADAQRAGYLVTSGFQTTAAVDRARAAPVAKASTASVAPSAVTPPEAAAAPAASSIAADTRVAESSSPDIAAAAPPSVPSAASGASGASAAGGASVASTASPSGAVRADDPTRAVEVAGIHLGMSPEEVRAVLRARGLLDYYEAHQSTATPAGDAARGRDRFVNMIAAWSAPGGAQGDGESIEVLFTPLPGKERVLAVVHTVAYAPGRAVRESALESLLVEKYGGFSAGSPLPASPTWRILRSGQVQVGDACEQRGQFGGLREISNTPPVRGNPALSTPLDELESQADRCGMAIVTEDHLSANGSAPRESRRVARFTITAYSPALALEGARAAQQAARVASPNARPARAAQGIEPTATDL